MLGKEVSGEGCGVFFFFFWGGGAGGWVFSLYPQTAGVHKAIKRSSIQDLFIYLGLFWVYFGFFFLVFWGSELVTKDKKGEEEGRKKEKERCN
jgi:hypothetical protein